MNIAFGQPQNSGYLSDRRTALTCAIDTEKLQPLFDLIQTHIDQHKYPGCQIAIAREGQVLVNRSVGLARIGHGHEADTQVLPADNDQLWLLYSNTKVLVASYSNDGGSTFLTGATYDLDGAEAGYEPPLNGGFTLELLASVNNIGSAVTSGQMSFDNLSVSAVPEPSTYAALAGLGALGFAVWRRRRKA